MGEVFLAEDTVLGRKVALKFLAKDAIKDPIARGRFLREAKSAAAIDDPFICKIYETGEVDGEPFIAMEYIEGESLGDRIQREPMSVEEVITTAAEIAEALGVAHENGIIHRDLKPSNIMLTTQGHAKVLDFGLAKQVFTAGNMDTSAETATSDDLTGHGITLGTLAYMSPEQLRAQPLTPKSDVFSFGIVLHEMLTGEHPFARPSSAETINAIMADPAPTPEDNEGKIPQELLEIHDKALAKTPEDRYQSAAEIVADLAEIRQAIEPMKKATHTIGIAMAIVLAAIVVVAGLRLLPRSADPVVTEVHEPMSVLIADFDNRTGEEVFDGALEQAVAIGLESAPFVNSYRRGRARQVAGQIQKGAESLDPEMARLVAQREAINVLVLGSISGSEGEYEISVEAVDGISGEVLAMHETRVAKKERVLEAIGDLVVRTRRSLGDTVPDSVKAIAEETFTASSLEAAKSYSLAQDLMVAGEWQDAIGQYQHTIQIDPDFGRAYAGAAACSANLGRLEQSLDHYRQAMAHIDRMTEREKRRTRGGYYLMIRDYEKAAEEYASLAAQFPFDAAGLSNLPLAYFYGRNMKAALEGGRRAVEAYPDQELIRGNFALYAMYAGDFDTAATEARLVLEANPAYETAYVALALAELGRGDTDAAVEAYENLRGVSSWGASLASTGLADLALFQGRSEDARVVLERGIAGDRAAGNESEAARKLIYAAHADLTAGRPDTAVKAAASALEASRRSVYLFACAMILVEAGEPEEALELASELAGSLSPEPQVFAKLVEGFVDIQAGQPQSAVATLRDAQRLIDTWLGRVLLGRAYLEADAFAEAHSELDEAIRRRGEATAVFLDDVPSYHYLPEVFYWLGLAQEGVGSSAAAESFRTFLAIKNKGAGGPLVADARSRLASSRASDQGTPGR
jgi:tetratricopeptide (TPR) repeat protein/tRNA A-37 threonylcarbamoyl transferase component Bud32